MTKNTTVNTALLTLGAFFVGIVPTVYKMNFWYAVVSALVGIFSFVVYDLLP